MRAKLSPGPILWSVGVLQPAQRSEVRHLLKTLLSGQDGDAVISPSALKALMSGSEATGHLIRFARDGRSLYSLTAEGNAHLPAPARLLRDKLRMYLLHSARRNRFRSSDGRLSRRLGGDSPPSDTSTDVKGSAANKSDWPLRGSNRTYWPRLSKQRDSRAGSSGSPSDSTLPGLLSFPSKLLAARAVGLTSGKDFEFDIVGLATCLGVSPALLSRIAYDPHRHYRTFELPKKGGGTRVIESPRTFLKVIQGFLLDFVLDGIRVHRSVHSFRFGRSTVTNALQHMRSRFVANVDIKEFFPSVPRDMIVKTLRANGFSENEAATISRLCVLNNRLPQGAPTSPLLSNAILYHFDEDMWEHCRANGLRYTRYADDITISGRSRTSVERATQRAQRLLDRQFGLTLNESKSRVASAASQQKVTGVVVNSQASPPRPYVRRVRAIFHQADHEPARFLARIPELGGHVGYLGCFPKYKGTATLDRYRNTIARIRSIGQQAHSAGR